MEQTDLVLIVAHQGGQSAAYAEIASHAIFRGVLVPQVFPFLRRDHLQGELVVIAQEGAPLAAIRDLRGSGKDVGDAHPRVLSEGHEEAWHHREVEGHLALVAGPEVLDDVVGPLIGLTEQNASRIFPVDHGPQVLEDLMGPGKVLTIRPILLDEVGHRVESESVNTHVHPEPHCIEHLVNDAWFVEIEIGLVVEESMPVVLPPFLVPFPVGLLGVEKDDAGVGVLLIGVGPHVEISEWAIRIAAGGLEPRVGVRGVVHDEVDDDAQTTVMGSIEECLEVLDRSQFLANPSVITDVVPTIAQWGVVERREPQAVHAEPLQVVQFGLQPLEVANAVAIGVLEGTHQHLVEDGGAEPLGVGAVQGARGADVVQRPGQLLGRHVEDVLVLRRIVSVRTWSLTVVEVGTV